MLHLLHNTFPPHNHPQLCVQIGGLCDVRYEIVGGNEVENLVQRVQQNVLDGARNDRPQCLRHRSPILVQIVIGAVLCANEYKKYNVVVC